MTRIDPFRDFDRLAEQLLAVGRDARTAPMDLYRAGEHYVLHLDLPGVDPGSLDIQLDNQILTIRAERSPRTAEELEWLVHERPTGTYQRQIKVGSGIDAGGVTADLEHGVLTLVLPVAEAAKPRKIAVQGATIDQGATLDNATIDGESTPAVAEGAAA